MSALMIIPIIIFGGGILLAIALTNIALANIDQSSKK